MAARCVDRIACMEDFFKYTEMSITLKEVFIQGFLNYILLRSFSTSILTQHREVPRLLFSIFFCWLDDYMIIGALQIYRGIVELWKEKYDSYGYN